MNPDELNESWHERMAAVAEIVRQGLPQFIGFELMLRAVGLAAFTPLTAWLMASLIAWSGDGAISNYDLAGFFLSFKGMVYLMVVFPVAFTLRSFVGKQAPRWEASPRSHLHAVTLARRADTADRRV